MFEDDVEDYFVEHESETPSASTAPASVSQEQEQVARVIDFGGTEAEEPEAQSQPADRSSNRFLSGLIKVAVVGLLISAGYCYFRYFSPIVDRAVMDVIVGDVQRRGVLFKTFEADLLEDGQMIKASVVNESVYIKLQSLQSSGQRIRVGYCKYSATLPWRGESEIVITDIVDR